ncbi:hypothetical protein BJX63DRAFT_41006 [Aspergillus granulosus]|uniref:Uncharacterized protein n=1 Tax=Aspergillus granulosus TaxID=176169 RepID=A0ABR4GYR5_9EURO
MICPVGQPDVPERPSARISPLRRLLPAPRTLTIPIISISWGTIAIAVITYKYANSPSGYLASAI